jgi:hypothetical protein
VSRDYESLGGVLIEEDEQSATASVAVGKRPRAGLVGAPRPEHNSVPGKVTLTQRLAPALARSVAPVLARDAEPGAPMPRRLPEAVTRLLDSTRGDPLPDAVRFTRVMGVDVSAARVVVGGDAERAAASVGARAFALGDRIVFGAGQYAPGTETGDRLLRHELTHVVQQGAQPVTRYDGIGITDHGDHAEQEARAIAAGSEAPAVTSAPVLARDGDGPRLDADDYLRRHWAVICNHDDGLKRWLGPFPSPGEEATWRGYHTPDNFKRTLALAIGSRGVDYLLAHVPEAERAVDRGRDTALSGRISSEFREEVARELAWQIQPRVAESLRRLAPQVAAVVWRLWEARPEGERGEIGDIDLPADALVASAPADNWVIPGLSIHPRPLLFITHLGAEAARLREVRSWSWHPDLEQWARITDPVDATAEEAAVLLYGDSALASYIVAAPPVFGFEPARLKPELRQQWLERNPRYDPARPPPNPDDDLDWRIDEGYAGEQPPNLEPTPPMPADPAGEMVDTGPVGDAAVAQAGRLPPTGAQSAEVVRRYTECLEMIEGMQSQIALMPDLGAGGLLQRVHQSIQARRMACEGSPAQAYDWDGHSAQQHDLIGRAATGLHGAHEKYVDITGPAPAAQAADAGPPDPAIQACVGGDTSQLPQPQVELTAVIRQPLYAWAEAFVRVAERSEIPSAGRSALVQAQERQQMFPIDMMEGILHVCRQELARVAQTADRTGSLTERLRSMERDLRARLYDARATLLRDPLAAQQILTEVMADLTEFQDLTGLISTFGSITELWTWLGQNGRSVWTFLGISDQEERYQAARAELECWREQYFQVYLDLLHAVTDEDRATATRRVQQLRNRAPELQARIREITQMVEDEEEKEKWMDLAGRIAVMVAIAVATMGVGTAIEGALLTGAGWGLTAGGTVAAVVVSAGAEAAVFTAMTTVIFQQDTTIGGVFRSFLENWVLFGAMKGMGFAIETYGAAQAARAATALGRRTIELTTSAANLSTNLITNIGYSMMQADAEARAQGRELSEDDKRMIVIEGIATFVGTMIAGRCSRTFLEGIRRDASTSWMARLATVDTMRAQALEAARGLGQRPTIDQIRELVSRDGETIRHELETLRELENWARDPANAAAARRLGITAEQLADLGALDQRALEARDRAGIALELEAVGGELFRCNPERFEDIIRRLRLLGDEVTITADSETGVSRAVARGADGTTMRIMSRPPGDALPGPAADAHAPAGGGPHIRDVDASALGAGPRSEGLRSAERWQTHGLETDPAAAPLMQDSLFREWYARWMEMPDRLTFDRNGRPRVNPPEGIPAEYLRQLQRVAEHGNIASSTRAVDIAEVLRTEFPEVRDLNPSSPDFQAARARLEARIGELLGNQAAGHRAVERYVQQAGDGSMPDRAAAEQRVTEVMSQSALDSLRATFSDGQVYLTGSLGQVGSGSKVAIDRQGRATVTRGGGATVQDVDVVIVVPESTPFEVRVAMEARANRMRLPTSPEYQAALRLAELPVTETLGVDAKVMTPREFAGWSMGGPERGVNLRIDAPLPPVEVAQPSMHGSDLHNHLLGPPGTSYFQQGPGRGTALGLFERIEQHFNTPPQRAGQQTLRDQAPDSWQVVQATREQIDALRARQAPQAEIDAVAARANERLLAASDQTSFNSAYEVRDALIQRDIDAGHQTYDNFIEDTIRGLNREGVSYSEQSVSLNKLERRIPSEAEMRRMHERLAAEGQDSDLRFLAMLNTEGLAPESAARAGRSAEQIQADFQRNLRTLERVLRRGDVMGVDFAGPERYAFTPEGMGNFEQVYRLLQQAGRQRGRPLVLRPHVGEGFLEPGAAPDAHVRTAQQNLLQLLARLEAMGHTGNPGQDGVVVRFGHATHVTPEILIRMQRVGIIVEANVASNLATGSIATIADHPLLYNLYYNVRTVLATDAGGVMGTTLPREYEVAREQIERYRRGDVALEIDGRRVPFNELDIGTQRRFTVDQLIGWAQDYRAGVHTGDQADSARTGSIVRPPTWRPGHDRDEDQRP